MLGGEAVLVLDVGKLALKGDKNNRNRQDDPRISIYSHQMVLTANNLTKSTSNNRVSE